MAFKSEIHVAELASIRTGHTEGDIYYILDNGMLGDLPCKPGTFVKWHNDTWQIQPDEHYALASAVAGAIAKGIKIAIFECRDNGSDQNFFTGPTYAELEASRTAGKTIVLLVHYGFDTVVDRYFEMTNYSFGRDAFTYQFTEANGGRVMQFSGTVGDVDHHAWSKASAYDSSLSSTSTNAVQNSALYAVIGDVETLLAAL